MISISTLFSNARTEIKNIISNNLVDVKNRYKTEIVKSGRITYPSQTGFCGYPYINIPPINIASESNYVNDNSSSEIEWEQLVEILADNNSNLDSMSDNVMNILKSTTHKNTLLTGGVKILSVNSAGYDEDIIEGKLIHVRKITLRFKNRI